MALPDDLGVLLEEEADPRGPPRGGGGAHGPECWGDCFLGSRVSNGPRKRPRLSARDRVGRPFRYERAAVGWRFDSAVGTSLLPYNMGHKVGRLWYPREHEGRSQLVGPVASRKSPKPRLGACTLPASGWANAGVSAESAAVPDSRRPSHLTGSVLASPYFCSRSPAGQSGSPCLGSASATLGKRPRMAMKWTTAEGSEIDSDRSPPRRDGSQPRGSPSPTRGISGAQPSPASESIMICRR